MNYNGENYLPDVLDGLLAQRAPIEEILVVDNASTDGSRDLVRERYPEVRLVERERNGGPSAARNSGYRIAAHRYVLFVDNDVTLHRSCTGRMLQALNSHPSAVFAMPRVLSARDPEIIDFEGARAHFTGLMRLEGRGRRVTEGTMHVRSIGSLVTACFLMDRQKWGQRPLFDEAFFIYLEDHDLGLRARTAGHTVLAVPDARCEHGEGTIGLSLRQAGGYTPARVFLVIRNRWMILLKTFEIRTLVILSPALIVFEICQLAGAVKKGWLVQWARAATSVVRQLPTILRKRREVNRRRTISDAEILTGGPIPFTDRLQSDSIERLAGRVLDRACQAVWSLGGPRL